MTKQLEQKIVAMLTDEKATSTNIETLLAQVDEAIVTADAAVVKIKELALDPIQMPDANRARASSVEDANFGVIRLERATIRLQKKLAAVHALKNLIAYRELTPF